MLSIECSEFEPIFIEGVSHGLSRKTVSALIERFEIEYLRSPKNFFELLEVVE